MNESDDVIPEETARMDVIVCGGIDADASLPWRVWDPAEPFISSAGDLITSHHLMCAG